MLQNKSKINIKHLQDKKSKEKIICMTAYDALFAGIFDGLVDLILIGDSLNMSFNGKKDTIDLSLDNIIYHSIAVSNAVKTSFLVADMPFGSYSNKKIAIKNAIKLYQKTSIDAVKIEISGNKRNIISSFVDEGIATIAHIGLKPQFSRAEGGYYTKGKTNESKNRLIEEALMLEEAGAIMILLEGIKNDVATEITSKLKIPTIGIGAGKECDGQILVWSDAFGFFDKFQPKFVRKFLNGREILEEAIKRYIDSIKSGDFPNNSESYL